MVRSPVSSSTPSALLDNRKPASPPCFSSFSPSELGLLVSSSSTSTTDARPRPSLTGQTRLSRRYAPTLSLPTLELSLLLNAVPRPLHPVRPPRELERSPHLLPHRNFHVRRQPPHLLRRSGVRLTIALLTFFPEAHLFPSRSNGIGSIGTVVAFVLGAVGVNLKGQLWANVACFLAAAPGLLYVAWNVTELPEQLFPSSPTLGPGSLDGDNEEKIKSGAVLPQLST